MDVLGQSILADSHGAEELREEDLPGVDGRKPLGHHSLLVVVGDLDVVGIAISPAEYCQTLRHLGLLGLDVGLEDRLDLAAQHRVDPPHPRRRFEAGEDLASLLGGRASFWVRRADGQSEGEPGLGHVEEHAQLTETLNRFPEAVDGLMSSLQRCYPSAQVPLLDLYEPST